jgi:hypothetical protein
MATREQRECEASFIAVAAEGHQVAAGSRSRDFGKGAHILGAQQHLQGKYFEPCGTFVAARGLREPRAEFGLLSVIACFRHRFPSRPRRLNAVAAIMFRVRLKIAKNAGRFR